MKHVSFLFLLLFLLVNCTGYENEPYDKVKTLPSEMVNQAFTSEIQMASDFPSTWATSSDSFRASIIFDNATINCGIAWDMEDGIITYAFGGGSCYQNTGTHLYQFGEVDSHIDEVSPDKLSVVIHGNFSNALLIGGTPSYITRKKLTIYGVVNPQTHSGDFTVIEVQDGRWEIE